MDDHSSYHIAANCAGNGMADLCYVRDNLPGSMAMASCTVLRTVPHNDCSGLPVDSAMAHCVQVGQQLASENFSVSSYLGTLLALGKIVSNSTSRALGHENAFLGFSKLSFWRLRIFHSNRDGNSDRLPLVTSLFLYVRVCQHRVRGTWPSPADSVQSKE